MALLNSIYIYIDGDQYECETASVSVSSNKEPINAMNQRNRARGHKGGVPRYDLSVELHHDGENDADFIKYHDNRTRFTTVLQYEDDYVETYEDCEIYDVEKSGSADDGVMVSLSITALTRTTSS